MDRFTFQSKIEEMKRKKPKLFALEWDDRTSSEMIEKIEKYYNVIFAESYKDFVNQYGGGYFGYIVIYSCDKEGKFFINKHVSKEWTIKKSFLPVVDFETGDLLGFEIKGGVCQNTVSLYTHGEDKLHNLGMDFYEAVLKYGLKFNE